MVVCTGEACARAGAYEILSDLKHKCRRAAGDVRIGSSRCLGHCQVAPAMVEDGKVLGGVSQKRIKVELSRLGLD